MPTWLFRGVGVFVGGAGSALRRGAVHRQPRGAMSLGRAVWQALALPLRAPASASLLGRHATCAQPTMSSSGVPGLPGSNMIYYLFVGVTVSGGGYYAYRTFTSDRARYTDRMASLQERTKADELPPGEDADPAEPGEESSAASDVDAVESAKVASGEIPGATEDRTEVAAIIQADSEDPGAITEEAGDAERSPERGNADAVQVAAVNVETGPGGTESGAGEVTSPEGTEASEGEVTGIGIEASPEGTEGTEGTEVTGISPEASPLGTDPSAEEASHERPAVPQQNDCPAGDPQLQEEKKSPVESEPPAGDELQEVPSDIPDAASAQG
ncbi:protein MGARP [Tachyglossus aculeatus]|uniref:protein MGARP n=1 Tax=Tachyglossus aculeatus TaxID=9261 RepID=UPI0018F6298B|nr:protein MGARP [Tachyglossus aculeatus]